MNLQDLKNQVTNLIEALVDQNELIRKNEGKIPAIELDLLMKNTRNLYEVLIQLQKINAADNNVIAEVTNEILQETIVEQPIETIAVVVPQPEIIHVPEPLIIPVSEPVTMQEAKEEIKKPGVEEKVMEERAKVIAKAVKPVVKNGNLFEETVAVADKFEIPTTIHDKLTRGKEDKSWNEKMNSQPLQDLKKSIGINEKFKFMNELFDGNLKEYNESIEVLNNCSSFADAENYIEQTLLSKYDWKKESGTYQSLMFLVQRKFNS